MQREPPFLLLILHLLHIWVFPPPAEKGSPPRDKNNHSHITISPSVEELTSDLKSTTVAEDNSVLKASKILISVFLSPVGGTAPLTCSFALLQHGVSIKATEGGRETEDNIG